MQGPVQQSTYRNDYYLNISFQGKEFTIHRPHILHLEAISKSPFFENGLFNFPPAFEKNDFEHFCQFLLSRDYGPSIPETLQKTAEKSTATSYLAKEQIHGPPYISDTTVSGPDPTPYLLSSVLSYNLAQRLSFQPLAANALQRMDSLPFTYEDPVLLLEHIYFKTVLSPATEIRHWVKRWLSRPLPADLFEEYARLFVSNLGVLELDFRYSEQFSSLKAKSLHLAQDITEVQRDIDLKSPSPDGRIPLSRTSWTAHPGTAGIPTSADNPSSWEAADRSFLRAASSLDHNHRIDEMTNGLAQAML